MFTPLLATKFYPPPPAPTLVSRVRLCERLDAGLHRKLTLISAPAGFGKTTLVSAWLAGVERPVAWLALDEEERAVSRFLTYVIGALQTVTPTTGQALLPLLHSPQPPPTTTILTALLNELAVLPNAQILVLDDYHLVEDHAVDDALAFLIEHLPPQLHLVITTREDPNLPLARLRARGQLTEIRAADLRFTPEEAAAFLNQMMKLDLSADLVAALDKRTEGWIAGLQLAAISLQGHPTTGDDDRTAFVHSFTGSHRFVMDYLVEEVLEQQPAAIQRFLLGTSILNRFCGPLCDAVLGDGATAGQATLEALEQANLFLIPLDNERRWYRYHHLFAELLRQRLGQAATIAPLDPTQADPAAATRTAQVAEYHRRASRWFEAQDLALEALHHALAAADFAHAADLLERVWRAMDDSRQTARWQHWVEQLPQELVESRPVLCAAYGWALLDRGELEVGERYLRAAEQFVERNSAATPTMPVANAAEFHALPATIAAARAYYALARGNLADTKSYAQRALELLPPDHHLRRGVPGALLGLAYWTDGELPLAYRTFAAAMASFRLAGNLLFAITGAYFLANMKRAQGRLHAAIEIHQHWLQLAKDQGELVQRGTADIYSGLSELAVAQGDLALAATYLQKSEELGAAAPLPRWRYRWLLAQAHLHQAQGNLGAALGQIEAAEQAYVRGPVPDVWPVAAMKARLWIALGRLDEAARWAQTATLTSGDDLVYMREYEQITLARLRLAQYRAQGEIALIHAAQELLARLQHAAEAGDRRGSLIEILLLQALAQEAQDELTAAETTLAQALHLAEPEGYVTLFTNEGAPLARLLTATATATISPRYLTALRTALALPSNVPPPHSTLPEQPLIEPLSERELEVLHLIAQGLSNREISDRLYLALSTVKGHNRNIFGKLQVQRRTEAVAKAQALGLV